MIDNPYTVKEQELEALIEQYSAEVEDLRAQLHWYKSFDMSAVTREVKEMSATERDLVKSIKSLDSEILKLEKKASEQAHSGKRKSIGWISIIWDKKDDTSDPLRKKLARKSEQEQKLSELRGEVASRSELLHRYSSLDLSELEMELADSVHKIGSEYVELSEVLKRKAVLDAKLELLERELTKTWQEIDYLQDRINKAEKLVARLNQSPGDAGRFERKKIHEESERVLDNGSPQNSLSRDKRTIDSRKRDAKKLELRIEEILLRDAQEVASLIIDGSNLCYEESHFIGLVALQNLCAELQKKYELTVVFDGSILKKLDLRDDADLRSQLPDVRVNVMANKESADEAILDAAGHDSKTFVISADRFVEYPDKVAVVDKRIIKPQLINQCVVIQHLGIDVPYQVAD
ncbi:hypothetical protein HMPREF0290_0042 [Corynebacterium efficiens YS-314]|uniref:RNase NYN domain-containing protein n=1 Tax=Corynebacterium efficiens (strain DSM 44549 / YS-314 / AJ 12310 / JCM 11189 / NBRC 100395) TaxID=196164 RepID=Q8FTP9_COREF|nr:hypothetical protein [Corynebacterium efficiens]EEW51339.1 hypothetical protein HMPREF0290_0042 [Corynebacterium efficiens YS-314]BAC18322.1 hypothetical protein [Corynebacterium efficiens YS-314]